MRLDPATGEVLDGDSTEEVPEPTEGNGIDELEEPGMDFRLYARDAADLVSEIRGTKVTAAGFRQLVMQGKAPAPCDGNDTNAQWSQAELSAWLDAPVPSTIEGKEEAAKEEPAVHRDVYDFYDRTFSLYYELYDTEPAVMNRKASPMVWCQQWWNHRSVVGRITAAWYAWETAHSQGGAAISSWILEHADRHHDRIMAEDGPLRLCTNTHKQSLDVYPTEPPPDSLRTNPEQPTDEGEEQ